MDQLPLREAAEAAARQATFAPTIQDGITVKVTGTLIYEFTKSCRYHLPRLH